MFGPRNRRKTHRPIYLRWFSTRRGYVIILHCSDLRVVILLNISYIWYTLVNNTLFFIHFSVYILAWKVYNRSREFRGACFRGISSDGNHDGFSRIKQFQWCIWSSQCPQLCSRASTGTYVWGKLDLSFPYRVHLHVPIVQMCMS